MFTNKTSDERGEALPRSMNCAHALFRKEFLDLPRCNSIQIFFRLQPTSLVVANHVARTLTCVSPMRSMQERLHRTNQGFDAMVLDSGNFELSLEHAPWQVIYLPGRGSVT